MAVRFVIGRAGSGKTRRCLDAIGRLLSADPPGRPAHADGTRADPRADPSGRLLLLAPEQATFEMERALLAVCGRPGYHRAEVLSFTRLAERLLDELETPPKLIGAAGRALLLRAILERDPGLRRPFGAAAETPGFYLRLDQTVRELLSEGGDPSRLRAAATSLPSSARRRAEAVSAVYEAYVAATGVSGSTEREAAAGPLDPAQLLRVARARIERVAWLRAARIWVDGFASFSGEELETLVALARAAREMTITLLADPRTLARASAAPELDLFRRTRRTYEQVTARLRQAGIELAPPDALTSTRRFASPILARLEAGLCEAAEHDADPDARDPLAEEVGADVETAHGSRAPAVVVLRCATHRDELRAAARTIRTRVVESAGALRFGDFALVARDLTPFASLAADVLAEYDIPHFIDLRTPMSSHALYRFVGALFDALSSDFAPAPTRRLLHSGLALKRGAAERLAQVVDERELRGAAVWAATDWSEHRLAPAVEESRRKFWRGLAPLVAAAGRERLPGADWARALYRTIAALRAPGRILRWIADAQDEGDWRTAELHRVAWKTLCDALDEMVAVLGGTRLDLAAAADVTLGALGERTLGIAPPTLDQTLVGSIERTRHPDVKHVWLFAFNDGVFPAATGADPLLPDETRRALCDAGFTSLAPRGDAAFDERLLAYIAATRPSHSLTISFAQTRPDGEPLPVSPLLAEFQRCLPELAIETPSGEAPPAHVRELARRAAGSAPGASAARELCAAMSAEEEIAGDALQALRRARELAGRPVACTVARQSRSKPYSLSEIKTWLECPFRHFAKYDLRVPDRRGPQNDPLLAGGAAHDLLRDVTRALLATRRKPADVDDEQWSLWLDEALVAWREAKAPLSPRAAFLLASLRPRVLRLLQAHVARWRRGAFAPQAVEISFGGPEGAEDWPALEIETDAGERILVQGRIDRLDRAQSDGGARLLVYDYKSTAKARREAYLMGAALQSFAYLLAVAQREPEADAAGYLLAPLYAGDEGGASSSGNDNAGADADDPGGSSDSDALMRVFRPSGAFSQSIARALDPQLGQAPSPVANMQLKKDGDHWADRDARRPAEIEARLELAQQTLSLAATGLLAGDVRVAPLLENDTLACKHCAYRPVCRFEKTKHVPRAAELALPTPNKLRAAPAGEAR